MVGHPAQEIASGERTVKRLGFRPAYLQDYQQPDPIRESGDKAGYPVVPWFPSRSAINRVRDVLPVPQKCPYCGGEVHLYHHEHVYRKVFGEWPWMYKCVNFPRCDASVGLHKFTHLPLGTLADKKLRTLRNSVKAEFHKLQKHWGYNRTDMYTWLANRMGIDKSRCHFGWFDTEMCNFAHHVLAAELNSEQGTQL